MIILEPKRINERFIKQQQRNKRLLMENEVLTFDDDLYIDKSWDFELDPNLIKTKKILGNIGLKLNHIPIWISNIEIDGYFNCSACELTSLINCPKTIKSSFNCSRNNLTSLDDGPTFVGYIYLCYNNSIQFTKEYVRSICNVKESIINI